MERNWILFVHCNQQLIYQAFIIAQTVYRPHLPNKLLNTQGIKIISTQIKMAKFHMMAISILLGSFTIYALLCLLLSSDTKHSIKSISNYSSPKIVVDHSVIEDIFSVLTSYNLKMEGSENDDQYKNTLDKFKEKIIEHNLENNIFLKRGFRSTSGPSSLKQITEYLQGNSKKVDKETTMTLEFKNLKVIGNTHITFYKFTQDTNSFGPQLFHISNSSFDGDLTIDALSPFVLSGNSFKNLQVNYGVDTTLGNNEYGAVVSLIKNNHISNNLMMLSYKLSQFIQDPYWEKILKNSPDDQLINWRVKVYLKGNIIKKNANFQLSNYGLGILEINNRNEIGSIDVYDTIYYKEKKPKSGTKSVSLKLKTDLKGNTPKGIITEVKIGPEEIIPSNSTQYEKHRSFFLYLKKQAIKSGDSYYEQVYDRTLRRLSYPTSSSRGIALLDQIDRAMYYGYSILTPILSIFVSMSLLAFFYTTFVNFDFAYIVSNYPRVFLRFLEFSWLDYKNLITNDIETTIMRDLILQTIYVASRLLYYPLVTFGIVRTVQRFFL